MQNQHFDFLVIGSGISGLTFALKAAESGSVLVITKDRKNENATNYAQGGIAAAIGEMDLPKSHIEDTLKAGAGLCDLEAVKVLVHDGIKYVNELINEGMQFTLNKDGKIHLGREGGHGQNRILHSHDHTGQSLESFLLTRIKSKPGIEIREYQVAIDLITEHHIDNHASDQINCYGAYILDEPSSDIYRVTADFICLATGGAGNVYPLTTNPAISTGDGIAMAYRAGCRVRNLEFVQFHPTALYVAEPFRKNKAFLIT